MSIYQKCFDSHERIIEAADYTLTQALFENLAIDSHGAAIYISNQDSHRISLTKCMFKVCMTIVEGGAIYINGKSVSLSIDMTIFDTCSVTVAKDVVFGNAISCRSTSSAVGICDINRSVYNSCGPKLSISSDCTVYLLYIKLSSYSTNFTSCHSTGGPTTFGINQLGGNAVYMQVDNGSALCHTCIWNSIFEVKKSNFIGLKQYAKERVFWGDSGSTHLTDCAIFIDTYYGSIGYCSFTNCVGNFASSNVNLTGTTFFPIEDFGLNLHCLGKFGDSNWKNLGRNVLVGFLSFHGKFIII